MPDEILTETKQITAQNASATAVEAKDAPAACSMQTKGWLKGALGMAICCGAPLLLFAAIAFFGLSLGAIASGAVSLVAVLACPVGMFFMMRMMMKDKK